MRKAGSLAAPGSASRSAGTGSTGSRPASAARKAPSPAGSTSLTSPRGPRRSPAVAKAPASSRPAAPKDGPGWKGPLDTAPAKAKAGATAKAKPTATAKVATRRRPLSGGAGTRRVVATEKEEPGREEEEVHAAEKVLAAAAEKVLQEDLQQVAREQGEEPLIADLGGTHSGGGDGGPSTTPVPEPASMSEPDVAEMEQEVMADVRPEVDMVATQAEEEIPAAAEQAGQGEEEIFVATVASFADEATTLSVSIDAELPNTTIDAVCEAEIELPADATPLTVAPTVDEGATEAPMSCTFYRNLNEDDAGGDGDVDRPMANGAKVPVTTAVEVMSDASDFVKELCAENQRLREEVERQRIQLEAMAREKLQAPVGEKPLATKSAFVDATEDSRTRLRGMSTRSTLAVAAQTITVAAPSIPAEPIAIGESSKLSALAAEVQSASGPSASSAPSAPSAPSAKQPGLETRDPRAYSPLRPAPFVGAPAGYVVVNSQFIQARTEDGLHHPAMTPMSPGTPSQPSPLLVRGPAAGGSSAASPLFHRPGGGYQPAVMVQPPAAEAQQATPATPRYPAADRSLSPGLGQRSPRLGSHMPPQHVQMTGWAQATHGPLTPRRPLVMPAAHVAAPLPGTASPRPLRSPAYLSPAGTAVSSTTPVETVLSGAFSPGPPRPKTIMATSRTLLSPQPGATSGRPFQVVHGAVLDLTSATVSSGVVSIAPTSSAATASSPNVMAPALNAAGTHVASEGHLTAPPSRPLHA
eukprot:TRINITY_DN13223_c0_g1_i1.p1 TRINITY_DN13223_c0_g1~~TRINITY_DN13223_c0_g1_i1.p1  ORF type:complete len:754 (-),score=173.50 TRINITY_DN13223_c0_g1_i1:220-2481(-)